MECRLCDLSPFWEHFWVIIGPGLTLIGSLLLVWVASKSFRAQGYKLPEIVHTKLKQAFTRKGGRDIVKVITEAVEVEESSDVATGKGYVASPQMQSTIASVARLREHERDDAFGRAVTAAASEMAAEVQTLEEQLELAEVRMASLDGRLDAADKTTKELRTLLFQISDMAGRDKAEVIKHIEDVELRGFWQSLWAAILIPAGIFLTIVLQVCHLGCPT